MNGKGTSRQIVRALVLAAIGLGAFAWPAFLHAGHMFLEYRGELAEGYTFYRGAFDLADIDHCGADEMVIADDEGGFHVYRFTRGGFVPMWIHTPIVEDGYIVAIEVLHENVPGIMPQIMLLDSHGTLHQVRYTGYLFEETATYENYRIPGESGRLMITDLGGGGRTVLIALPDPDGEAVEAPDETGGNDLQKWTGMTLYRLTAGGLVELTGEEMSSLAEGEVYFVRGLTALDVTRLRTLGSAAGRLFPGSSNESGRAGIADLDRDALFELLVQVSDPNRPIDRLEIYSEESGDFTVRITLELPLINEMVLGDIDGDRVTEIVGLTYDGVVLVYQYDPLTILLADGSELQWEIPHLEIDGTIWMSLGGFEALGCEAVEEPDKLILSLNEQSVVLSRTDGSIRCGEEILLPEVPDEVLESIPYLPLFSTLDCLGFLYTYDPGLNLVEVEPEE